MLDSGLKVVAHVLRRFAMPIERPAPATKIHRRLSDSDSEPIDELGKVFLRIDQRVIAPAGRDRWAPAQVSRLLAA
jgi:hypothetical protein